MFDYHMHSKVSFDGKSDALEMALAAKERGLKEICFTDHIDREINVEKEIMVFDTQVYRDTYENLEVPGLKIRKGVEYGIKVGCTEQAREDLKRYDFDFILGSVHFVKEVDVYLEPYWEGKNLQEAYREFMEETLACVQEHDHFDVLGHLTFICKGRGNPYKELLYYKDHREIVDEILRELEQDKGATAAPAVPTQGQVSLGDIGGETVLRKLRMTDVNILSPIEALNLLAELKQDLN